MASSGRAKAPGAGLHDLLKEQPMTYCEKK